MSKLKICTIGLSILVLVALSLASFALRPVVKAPPAEVVDVGHPQGLFLPWVPVSGTSNARSYVITGNSVSHNGNVYPQADPATFRVATYANTQEANQWAKDSKHVFDISASSEVPIYVEHDVDSTTFEIYSTKYYPYFRDSRHVFICKGGVDDTCVLSVLAGADVASFSLVQGENEDSHDAIHKYYHGQIVP